MSKFYDNYLKTLEEAEKRLDQEAMDLAIEPDDDNPEVEELIKDVKSGVIDNYKVNTSGLDAGGKTNAHKRINSARSKLMVKARDDVNAFVGQALNAAIQKISEIEDIVSAIVTESAAISAQAAAELIFPPDRQKFSELGDNLSTTAEIGIATADRLASGSAMRGNERMSLVGGGDVIAEANEIAVVAGSNLPVSVASSLGAAIREISGLTLCMAIDSVAGMKASSSRAASKVSELLAIVDGAKEMMGPDFVSDLQVLVNEAASDAIHNISDKINDMADANKNWLALAQSIGASVTTTVSDMEADVGDIDTGVADAVFSHCQDSRENFCATHSQVLEALTGLLGELSEIKPSKEAWATVDMAVHTPDAEDVRVVASVPEREVSGILVSSSGLDLVMKSSQTSREASDTNTFTDGIVEADTEIGDTKLRVLIDINSVPEVNGTIGALKYSGRRKDSPGIWVFLLENEIESKIDAGVVVTVPTVIKDDFSRSMQDRQQISDGGVGRIKIGSKYQKSQTLDYDDVIYNGNGKYTFSLTSPPTPLPIPAIVGKAKKPTQLCPKPVIGAYRFNVNGKEIVPESPGFLFSEHIDIVDYIESGDKRIGVNGHDGYWTVDQSLSTDTKWVCTTALIDGRMSLLSLDIPDMDMVTGTFTDAVSDIESDADFHLGHVKERFSSPANAAPMSSTGIQVLTLKQPILHGDENIVTVSCSFSSTTATVVSLTRTWAGMQTIAITPKIFPGTIVVNTSGDGVVSGARAVDVTKVGAKFFVSGHTFTVKTIDGDSLTVETPPSSEIFGSWMPVMTGTTLVSIDRKHELFNRPWHITGDSVVVESLSIAYPKQEFSTPSSVTAFPASMSEYLNHFTDEKANVTTRDTLASTPDGSHTFRAVFVNESEKSLFHDMVIESREAFVVTQNRVIPLSPNHTIDGGGIVRFVAEFPLSSPLVNGQILKIAVSPFRDLALDVIDTMAPLQDAVNSIGEVIEYIDHMFCSLLSGRPLDVGLKTAALTALASGMLGLLTVTRLGLSAVLAGLGEIDDIEREAVSLRALGFDRAADIVHSGDLRNIAKLSPESGTYESEIIKSADEYEKSDQTMADVAASRDIASGIKSKIYDKEVLATSVLSYNELAARKIAAKKIAIKSMTDRVRSL